MMNKFMSMQIKPLITAFALSVLSIVIFFPSISYADHIVDRASFNHSKGAGYNYDRMMKKMVKVLGLNEQQQTEIKQIKVQAREQHSALFESIKLYRNEQASLIHADVFDEQAFIVLHAAYQPSFAQAVLNRAKTKHAIFKVLTVEQQDKWQLFLARKKNGRKKHH